MARPAVLRRLGLFKRSAVPTVVSRSWDWFGFEECGLRVAFTFRILSSLRYQIEPSSTDAPMDKVKLKVSASSGLCAIYLHST